MDQHIIRLITLNAMKASDEITEDQARQVRSYAIKDCQNSNLDIIVASV
jgi:hypothetical protein